MGAPQKRKPRNELAGLGAVFKKTQYGGNDTATTGYVKQLRADHRQKRGWKRGQR